MFHDTVTRFIESQKDVLNQIYSAGTAAPLEKAGKDNLSELYETPPPLEYHMMVDTECRTQRALQLMVPGRVIEGVVTQISSGGLHVELNNFSNFTISSVSLSNAELIDLRIKGLVKLENLTPDPAKGKDALMDYRVDDVIRAHVISVENNIVQLSFVTDSKDIKLGYIDKELPASAKIPGPKDYINSLTSSSGFRNPSCIENIKQVLGISSCRDTNSCTLLRPILMTPIKEHEYFDSLRKTQRYRWSMDMVGTGVTLFKINRHVEALKYYDYALDIDSSNEEALVARGALYVKKGQYEKAIGDFESALTLNHSHSNAKKYLVEAQTRYGKELEEQGDMKGALRCYREALADSPDSEPAKTRAELLTAVIEKQAAEKREKEKRKRDEEARLKKLQKIIEKEHHGKKRKKKSKKKRRDSTPSSSSSYSSPEISSRSKRHKH